MKIIILDNILSQILTKISLTIWIMKFPKKQWKLKRKSFTIYKTVLFIFNQNTINNRVLLKTQLRNYLIMNGLNGLMRNKRCWIVQRLDIKQLDKIIHFKVIKNWLKKKFWRWKNYYGHYLHHLNFNNFQVWEKKEKIYLSQIISITIKLKKELQ